jgi:hypothetical protein
MFLAVFIITTLLCVNSGCGGIWTTKCPKGHEYPTTATKCPICGATKTCPKGHKYSATDTKCPTCEKEEEIEKKNVEIKKTQGKYNVLWYIFIIVIILGIIAVGHAFNRGLERGGMEQALKDKILFEQQGFYCVIRKNNGRIDLVVYKEDQVTIKTTRHYDDKQTLQTKTT